MYIPTLVTTLSPVKPPPPTRHRAHVGIKLHLLTASASI